MRRHSIVVAFVLLVGAQVACSKGETSAADTSAPSMAPAPAAAVDTVVPPVVLEGYPDEIIDAINRRATRALQRAQIGVLGTNKAMQELRSVIVIGRTWPSRVVTVAFKGGNPAHWKTIADATVPWSTAAGITLDFWTDASKKTLRTWSENDIDYRADVRISFSDSSTWSLVGVDARDLRTAGEASMNFAGFSRPVLPSGWMALVLHEFGHMMGLQHEHQNPKQDCVNEYRWTGDAGYVPKMDKFGAWTTDDAGRHPDVYFYLGGAPNRWSATMVDYNLRDLPYDRKYKVGTYDRTSIMHYHFEPWLFKDGEKSKCYAPTSSTASLSEGDRRVVAEIYPTLASGKVVVEQKIDLAVDTHLKEIITGDPAARRKLAIVIGTMRKDATRQ